MPKYRISWEEPDGKKADFVEASCLLEAMMEASIRKAKAERGAAQKAQQKEIYA